MTHTILQNNMMDAVQHCAHNFASGFADTLHTVGHEAFTTLVVVANIDVDAVLQGLDSTYCGHAAGMRCTLSILNLQ